MTIRFTSSRITSIRQEERNVHVRGAKDEAEFTTVRGDWWLTINHTYSFNVGAEQPTQYKVGDRVDITIQHSKPEAAVTAPAQPLPSAPASEADVHA